MIGTYNKLVEMVLLIKSSFGCFINRHRYDSTVIVACATDVA